MRENGAIIGGGIIGLMMAFGLLNRGVRLAAYERTESYDEISAGFVFTGVARECMKHLDPRVLDALRAVGEVFRHSYHRYWDGFNPTTKEAGQSEDALLFQVPAGEQNFWGCLRSHLLLEMFDRLPQGVVKFGKHLDTCVDESGGKVLLSFADGSVVGVDAVIGCDGIRSRTRQILLGEDSLESYASYTHKVAYRAVVPITGAIAALGHDKATNPGAHLGPDAHVVSYPVDKCTLLNLAIFLYDPEPWTEAKMTAPGSREEVQEALADWSPAVRELVDLLPERVMKWGIFDNAEHPAPTYARGRVCIAGDAAHASSPFHGVGACMGVEDALVIATVLDMVNTRARDGSIATGSVGGAVASTFRSFNAVRLERSNWMTQSSREMGDIYEWRHPATGRDAEKCKAEFERRSRIVWDFDVDKMVAEVKSECGRRLNIWR
ncbi:hypothetical protein F4677DRAFT_457719 [Hypoxylon crocopeplum]|nr:hypothetical protein F4677DRAFT_457719 [Hypoxylon crocopeplum]